ncbi:MAG: GerMN domain-containing protein [Candidatus Methylomirabilaceae bacterium]
MTLKKAGVALAVVLLAATGVIALWGDQPTTFKRPVFRRLTSESPAPKSRAPRRIVMLLFADKNQNDLLEEAREIEGGTTATEDAKRILEELVKGPEGDLKPVIPRAAQVRNLFIDASGTAYVDFDHELAEGHPGGAREELFTVYSIVGTLAVNISRIKRVQILVDGAGIPTLAGDVDTRAPLLPRFTF